MKHRLIASRYMIISDKIMIFEGFDDATGRCLSVFAKADLSYVRNSDFKMKHWYPCVFDGIEIDFKYFKDKNDDKKFYAWVVN